MEPNDKAYAVARKVAYNRINESFVFDLIKEAVDAAYAAQFYPSKDYVGLVKELREDVLQFNLKNTAYENIANEAADAIETLLAKLNNKLKPSEDYAELIDRLRFRAGIYKGTTDDRAAADALEALLAERDALKAELAAANKRAANRLAVEAERDALLAERDALKDILPNQNHEGRAPIPTDWWGVAVLERRKRRAAEKERDALLARFAPVEAIENDKDDPSREYIPLPGGWEIQTKGNGSSYRLLDKKTGERHMILAGEAPFVQEFVTQMAKEINANAQVRPVAPVDDEALVEIAAHCEAIFDGWTFSSLERLSQDVYRVRAHQLLASIRPHIEAAERERCAKAVEKVAGRINVPLYERPAYEDGYLQGVHDAAAAIRSEK